MACLPASSSKVAGLAMTDTLAPGGLSGPLAQGMRRATKLKKPSAVNNDNNVVCNVGTQLEPGRVLDSLGDRVSLHQERPLFT